MWRDLALDARTGPRSTIFLAMTALLLAHAAVVADFGAASLFVFLLIAMSGRPHADLDGSARPGVLHQVLGVSRRRVVRARYLRILLGAIVAATIGLLVAAGWATVGRAVPSLTGYLGAVAAGLLSASMTAALWYCTTRRVAVTGTFLIVVPLAIAFGLPTSLYPDEGVEIVGWASLPVGPLPLGAYVAALAAITFVLGERFSEAAYVRCHL